MMSDKTSVLILYGDFDFDGRAKRMLEVAETFGPVIVLDASTGSLDNCSASNRRRVMLRPYWRTPVRHLVFWSRAVFEVCRLRPDLVFSENFFTTLPAWLAARIVGARYIYDAYELIIPEPGMTIPFRDRFWSFLEKFTAQRADLVVAANPQRADIMSQYYRVDNRLSYMRNIPQQVEVTAAQCRSALKAYPALKKTGEDDVIILYQGDVTLTRRLGVFVEALSNLPTNYRLVIVGDGPDVEKLKQLAIDNDVADRFETIGRVPNEILPSITKHADIGVVSYPYEGWNNIYCAPNKVFEYAFAGLPVISSDQPPLKTLIAEFQIGELFGIEETAASVASKIRKIRGKLSKEKICYVMKDYSNEIESQRIESRIIDIL